MSVPEVTQGSFQTFQLARIREAAGAFAPSWGGQGIFAAIMHYQAHGGA